VSSIPDGEQALNLAPNATAASNAEGRGFEARRPLFIASHWLA
jgi:hypothetical protein